MTVTMRADHPDTLNQPRGNSDDTISAREIRDRYDRSNRTLTRELQHFEIAKSFLGGDQWVQWSDARRRVQPVPRLGTRVRRTNNRITPSTRTIMAKLLRRSLVFEVPPLASDDATIRGARTGAAVLHHAHREHKWEQLREQAAVACWQGGTGLLAVDWDAQAGTGLGVDALTGQGFGTGDIACSALSIAEAATVPGAADIERARWWIRAAALPPEDVQALYRLDRKPAADVQGAISPLRYTPSERPNQKPDLTLVLHYYQRPFGRAPGQVAVVVGERIVDGPKPWPFPFDDRLNVVAMRDIYVLNRWTGDAILWTAIPQQTGLNLAESSIAEHMRQASNARIGAPRGAFDDLDSFTDEPGEVFEYNPIGGHRPEWLSPPEMPAWWREEPVRLKADIDDVLGVHDISRGAAPPNVDSGVALQLLAEQDDTPIGKFAREMADAWARYASLVLKIYEQKVTETRKARIDVPGQAPETREWTGKDLAGQTEASVPFDAVSPVSRTAMFSKAMALWNAKLISDPKQFARIAELADADDYTQGLDPDVAKARRENHRLALGDPVPPAIFDVHAAHIAEHNTFRKTTRYEELDRRYRELVDMHIQGHEVMAAEEMGDRLARAQVHPELANAALGHDPAALSTPAAALPPTAGPPAGMPGAGGGLSAPLSAGDEPGTLG